MDKRYSIAIFGADETSAYGDQVLDLARDLGRSVAKAGHVTVVNAANGFCLWAAMGAKEAGGSVLGFSPAASSQEHREVFQLPTDYCDMVVYTGFGFSGRDVVATRSVDGVMFGPGGINVLHEFAGAFQAEKITGVLEGPWDTDEVLREITEAHKPNRHVVFDDRPEDLVQKVINLISDSKA